MAESVPCMCVRKITHISTTLHLNTLLCVLCVITLVLCCCTMQKIIGVCPVRLVPFLNQACAGRCAWFLKIVSVQTSVCVFVCVCVRPKAVNN